MSSESDFTFLAADAVRRSMPHLFGDKPALVHEGEPAGHWETVFLAFRCEGRSVRQARGDTHSEAWARVREQLDAAARQASELLYEETFSQLPAFELMASIESGLEKWGDVTRADDVYTFTLPIDYRAL